MVVAVGGAVMLVQFGLMLGALAVALAVLARKDRRRRGQGTIALGPQHAVHVVTVEGRRLVVGVGPSAAPRLLCELVGSAQPGEAPEGQDRVQVPAGRVGPRRRGGWHHGA